MQHSSTQCKQFISEVVMKYSPCRYQLTENIRAMRLALTFITVESVTTTIDLIALITRESEQRSNLRLSHSEYSETYFWLNTVGI